MQNGSLPVINIRDTMHTLSSINQAQRVVKEILEPLYACFGSPLQHQEVHTLLETSHRLNYLKLYAVVINELC